MALTSADTATKAVSRRKQQAKVVAVRMPDARTDTELAVADTVPASGASMRNVGENGSVKERVSDTVPASGASTTSAARRRSAPESESTSESADESTRLPRLGISRYFTSARNSEPSEDIEWEIRDARLIDHRDSTVAFEQTDVEVPTSWSQNATNILAQKYFRGTLGTSERETSLRQVVDRIVGTITEWGNDEGYFADEAEAETFSDELSYLLFTQKAAFNSPVWFNIGVANVKQQASACFILSVDDTLDSILNWYTEEGLIFKGGSGSGVNLSRIRASCESLRGGGTASGPVSFMRGADSSAGTVKSGGKTRRAAKMVVLDADHPDIEEFVWCKAREERKARVLSQAGFDMGIDGVDSISVQYQNANNSVRVTDEFMQAVIDDEDWELTARLDGSVVRRVPARGLLRQISEAAWECADPGMQFHTTINNWHTAATTGPISASNPCSEYVHLDDSACNLASLNLLSFLNEDDTFDVTGFRHAVRLLFTAQEILVGNADYPTEAIATTTREFRQLGLGYANLGALLMALGMPYDSDEGRATAASITSLMTGEAYSQSTRVAARLGSFDGYHENRVHMLKVLDMHRSATADIDTKLAPLEILEAAEITWGEACERAVVHGVRNSQATVLAPTGTIGLLMDCDTTGIEPDLALVKLKKLVGGGTMEIVNRTIPRALRRLGYLTRSQQILSYIAENHSVVGSPLDQKHLPVFQCSFGENSISWQGHVKMMAAVQPMLSGAISKTVNVPNDATVEEIEQLFIESWQLGLKAVAIYRDNCKVDQPLRSAAADDTEEGASIFNGNGDTARNKMNDNTTVSVPSRQSLPRIRQSRTFEFKVADCKGFVTVGEYDDGRPGEIFVRVSKQGSTLAGIMDAFAISLSHGLQYGVPLGAFCRAFVGMRFEPAGITDDPDIRIATSLMDYLFRKLAIMYLEPEVRISLGIYTTNERIQPTLPGVEEHAAIEETVGMDLSDGNPVALLDAEKIATNQVFLDSITSGGPLCMTCGVKMQRSGSCFVCINCGSTSGCS